LITIVFLYELRSYTASHMFHNNRERCNSNSYTAETSQPVADRSKPVSETTSKSLSHALIEELLRLLLAANLPSIERNTD